MAKSRKMEKMSVLEEFMETPDDTYLTPDISKESLDKIAQNTAMADMPIEAKIKRNAQKETASNNTVLPDTVLKNESAASDTVSKIETVSSDIVSHSNTVSTNTVSKIDTVLETVLKKPKPKPSFLETLILKEMVARLSHGISTFQAAEIAAEVNTTLGGVRNALNMLKRKGLIENVGFKKGNRVGSTSFKINPIVFEILHRFEPKKETVLNNTVSANTVLETVLNAPLVSKKEESSFILTEALQKIGLRPNHLLKTTRSAEDVQEILFHFSHSIENKEIKSQNKLPVLLSILNNPEKQWVSESYLRDIGQEISANEDRFLKVKELEKRKAEMALKEKYEEFKRQNPDYLQQIKKQNAFVANDEVADKVGYSKFLENQA